MREEGIKHDQEKPNIALISSWWIEGVAQVLTFGARKYSADNWREGLSIRRLMAAAFRHGFAFLRGEDLDPETGLSHLLHMSCCIMFAYETWLLRKKFDDRWRPDGTDSNNSEAS